MKPIKMRRRRYRGHDSHGMLCSLIELGWARTARGARTDREQVNFDPAVDQVAVLRDMNPGDVLPEAAYWRAVVASPDPNYFDPNTEELDLREVRADD
jgi:hypothetical protein